VKSERTIETEQVVHRHTKELSPSAVRTIAFQSGVLVRSPPITQDLDAAGRTEAA
jgi:hypothetical protein